MTISDSYPLRRKDEYIDSLRDTEIFTTVDENSGFWQIQMDPGAQHLTHFHVSIRSIPLSTHDLRSGELPGHVPARERRGTRIRMFAVFPCIPGRRYHLLQDLRGPLRAHRRRFPDSRSSRRISSTVQMYVFSDQVYYLGHVMLPRKLDVSSKTFKAVQNLKPFRTTTDLPSFRKLYSVFRLFYPSRPLVGSAQQEAYKGRCKHI